MSHRTICHLGLAVVVVLAGCSRSSPPAQRTAAEEREIELAKLTNDLEITMAALAKLTNDLENSLAKGRTVMKGEFTLSRQQPSDLSLGARLVEVAADGTTTLEVLKTGQKLRAGKDQFFVSPEYGQKGLRVVSASSERQEVRLERIWCE